MGGKKIMGLPVVVWMGVAAAGLLLGIYLRRKGSSSGTVASTTSYPLSTTVPGTTDLSGLTGAVAGGGLAQGSTVSAIDPQTLNDLLSGQASVTGAEQVLTEQTQGLTDAIGSLVFSMPSSGGSGASAAGQKTSPLSTSTKPVKTKAPAAKAKAITPVHYYTYKKDVALLKGQTLHFASGKGYYGA